ncbi:DUF1360 domain-containing protein [Streptomyces sp. ICBB 8177]|uniref:DUF1360 domain-containing protein n=1 Tax=Streptomyces sp. ICBB 8177 TaxID=563922 RepID=UPI000D67C77C|nr:DUF1360 domain-containing protein [Streptomyces sp. ICBB 8177]PWI42972.1 hypothetical protein CK485_12080 [Streptomyces sp. ICBB 8177]
MPTSDSGNPVSDTLDEYAGESGHPVAHYAALMAVYATAVGGVTAVVRAKRLPVPQPGPWDVLLCAGATHRLSRLLSKDPVTSPLRAPFTRFEGTSGPSELAEDVRGSGLRKALGELVTCPFCVGLWVATALSAGLVLAPRVTRLAAATLTADAASDLLHFVRVRLQHAAGE